MRKPLRVLMLASYFPKPTNPLMGTWALSQAQALRRHGLELEVVSLTSWVPKALAVTNGAKAYATCPGVHDWDGLRVTYPRWLVYPVKPFRPWSDQHPGVPMRLGWRSAQRVLGQAVQRLRPDVIYAHHTAVNGYLALRLKQLFHVPYVITDHDFDEIDSCAHWPDRRRFFAPIVEQSAAMVAVASRMATSMQRLFPAARVCAVPNGTDEIPAGMFENPRPEEIRGRTVIFSCGAFYERKGFPLLVEAFAKVAQRHPGAILRIAGDGVQRPAVEAAIGRHRLDGQVQLLGFQTHRAVLQEMVWADVFALVGWDEPFATVFSEAMSAGTPIVCASDGGITDVLQHGVHGLTVRPKDVGDAAAGLGRLLEERGLRETLGRNAKDLFRTRLGWHHNADAMCRLFEGALRHA